MIGIPPESPFFCFQQCTSIFLSILSWLGRSPGEPVSQPHSKTWRRDSLSTTVEPIWWNRMKMGVDTGKPVGEFLSDLVSGTDVHLQTCNCLHELKQA